MSIDHWHEPMISEESIRGRFGDLVEQRPTGVNAIRGYGKGN